MSGPKISVFAFNSTVDACKYSRYFATSTGAKKKVDIYIYFFFEIFLLTEFSFSQGETLNICETFKFCNVILLTEPMRKKNMYCVCSGTQYI